MSLPPISTLSSSPQDLQHIISSLFEPSPTIFSLLASKLPRSFASYNEFIDFAADEMLAAVQRDEEKAKAIIAAHPRLGARKVESVHSSEEQKSLQVEGREEERRKLEALNREYEERFDGLRYV